jgi:hypothetical protein
MSFHWLESNNATASTLKLVPSTAWNIPLVDAIDDLLHLPFNNFFGYFCW